MRLLPPNKELGWTPYVWLVYLGFFFIQPIFGQANWKEWLATALGSLVFLVLYFVSYWLPGRRRLWIVAAITLLGVGFAPFNGGAAVFFIYAAASVAFIGDSFFAFAAIAVVVAVAVAETLVLQLDRTSGSSARFSGRDRVRQYSLRAKGSG